MNKEEKLLWLLGFSLHTVDPDTRREIIETASRLLPPEHLASEEALDLLREATETYEKYRM